MSEVGRVTQISGNVNQGYIAGRDLYLGDQYVAQETLFFEPDLKDVEPPAWTTTSKAEELARELRKNRLIILAGQDLDNKTMVARHLAWLLRQELPGEVRVREWYRSSDPQKIESAFHESATTILLLPQVLPHHIGHRLHDLIRLLHSRHNYTVITTDGSQAEWGIRSGSSEEGLWRELSWETYYGRAFLASTLLAELDSQDGRFPDWLPQDLRADSHLTAGVTVEEAAVRLKQPDRILRFTEWLKTPEASARALLDELDQLGGDRPAIFNWYRQLDRTDQLLALGLVLFDGLPDDQIFAAVEYLVDEAWRRTDPNLPLFDYRDLTRLGAYFHLAEAGEDGARIETPSRQKREAILQAAWELQRRRMLVVVPAMTRLIRRFSPAGEGPAGTTASQEEGSSTGNGRNDPAGPKLSKPAKKRRSGKREKKPSGKPGQEDADDWRFTQGPERELFSSRRRVEQLQRAVVESLSQIGLLSFEAVEASFLELAVDGSMEVQTVVAKALAAWRGQGYHGRFFQVLRDWWEAGSRTTLPKILEQRTAKGADALAAIRATVALAAGYALQYDPPNELAPELAGLLKVVLMDAHPAVRRRVLELALPIAAATHPQQLEPILRDRIGQDQEQMYSIAFGIGMGFSLHPVGALRILESWHAMVNAQGPREAGDRTITPRDRLLSAVVLAYGYIHCEPGQDLLSPDQIVFVLRSILTTERHPFVRTNTLMAAGLQGVHNFEPVAELLMGQISEIALSDRANVVSVFVRAYLKQRERLAGGDGEIESEGRTYQIWTRTPRPLTAIESSLYSWLRNPDHPVARQVAAQIFAAFAATDLERRERNVGGTIERSPEPLSTLPVRVAPHPRRLRRLPLFGYAAVLAAAPFWRPVRRLIRPVMAEVIALERSPAKGVAEGKTSGGEPFARAVLDRWRANDDQEVRRLARSAKTALTVFRWRWVFFVTALLVAVLYQDWNEWSWSHADPLPAVDTMALQQKRATPLRLTRNRWMKEIEKLLEEQRKAAEAEKELAQETPAEAPKPARKIPSGPMQQVRWSAKLAVPRVALGAPWIRKVSGPEILRLLRLLEAEDDPQKAAEAGGQAGMALKAAEALQAPKPEPLKAQARQPMATAYPATAAPSRRVTTQAPSGSEEALPAREPQETTSTSIPMSEAPVEEPSRMEPASPTRPQLMPPPVQLQVPKPSWLKKLHWPRRKKEPEKGDDHGNG